MIIDRTCDKMIAKTLVNKIGRTLSIEFKNPTVTVKRPRPNRFQPFANGSAIVAAKYCT
jgi:hypothetical protein